MQTFLPYASFRESARCLDYKRLGKQRIEAKQIINILTGLSNKKGWTKHPAVLMWNGHTDSLKMYYNEIVSEWVRRGYKNNMPLYKEVMTTQTYFVKVPIWIDIPAFHASHRSNLLRKDFEFYSKYNWKESDDIPYYWPTKELDGI